MKKRCISRLSLFLAIVLLMGALISCLPVTVAEETEAVQLPLAQPAAPVSPPRPTPEPMVKPAEKPAEEPTEEPVEQAAVKPDTTPTAEPVLEPTAVPAAEPTVETTVEPTVELTVEITAEPTEEITVEPTVEPTEEITVEPTAEPTEEITVEPTVEPTEEITVEPTFEPTEEITVEPTLAPILDPDATLDPDASLEPCVSPDPDATLDPDASVEPGVSPEPSLTPVPSEEEYDEEADDSSNEHNYHSPYAHDYYLDAKHLDIPKDGMPIPRIFQFDYRHTVCHIDGRRRSVSTSGCGATAVSMVIAYLQQDYEQTPYTLFYRAEQDGDYYGSGLSYGALQRMLSRYEIKSSLWRSTQENIQTALSQGMPVIINMKHGTFTRGGGHYVVLRGFNEDGEVLVNDPNSRRRSTEMSYSLKHIVSQSKTGNMLVARIPEPKNDDEAPLSTVLQPAEPMAATLTADDVQNPPVQAASLEPASASINSSETVQSETPVSAPSESKPTSQAAVMTQDPIVSDMPIAMQDPVVNDTPVVTHDPVAVDTPVVVQDPVAVDTPM